MDLPSALPATFTTGEALTAGIHSRDLYRWRDVGLMVELSRGVFRRADAPAASYPDLLAVSRRAPRAAVCMVSAAEVHELTDEISRAVQIAVPRGTRPPQITYPPVEVFRFAAATFDLGMEILEAAPGENVRITNPARTVVDLMRLRRSIGEPLALVALRRYLARGGRPAALVELARPLDILGPIRAAVDVLEAS
jgi:predicted transcriptional regulator of viral defense system